MGTAVDTNEVFDFVLCNEKDKAEGVRKSFQFRYVSYADFKRIDKLFKEADKAKTEEDVDTNTFGAMRIGLVGWRNCSIPYDPTKIDEVMSLADLIEVRDTLLEQLTLTEIDRKKSLQLSQRNSALSARGTKAPEVAESAPPLIP